MKFATLALIVPLLFPSSAYAYLDPGTGSILLQSLMGIALAVGVFWRQLRNKLKELLGKNSSKDDPTCKK